METKYYLPGLGGQAKIKDDDDSMYQSSPLLNTYSPRLFGAPPQLTHLNDMRLKSSNPNTGIPGPVGDFYLTDVLQDACVVNICVGKALFTGGMSSLGNVIRTAGQYAKAFADYDIFGNDGQSSVKNEAVRQSVENSNNIDAYNAAMGNDDGSIQTMSASDLQSYAQLQGYNSGLEESTTIARLDESSHNILQGLSYILNGSGALFAPLLTSLSVQQPFYTFESDWYSYINNVKMMINTAVIMLGLQKACVRIGDKYLPIGMDAKVRKDTDVWSNYRFITPTSGLGAVTQFDSQKGDSSQYVSFMVEPNGFNETYNNTIEESQLYSSVMNRGNSIGSEIAFITNSTINSVDDAVINLAQSGVEAANAVLSSMAGGVGRFTAAIAGSMARSYLGDHTIYPQVFTGHRSNESSISLTVKLSASSGDPYAYLTDILVPMFFALGLALPGMSRNNASAYTYPPIIQYTIPGQISSRLAMVESLTIAKNQDGKQVSKHGFPLSVTMTINIQDLQHTLFTSPMNEVSTMLNNAPMFDYIAACSGVDRYRVNGSARLVSRLALAASAASPQNIFHNIGDAMLTDFTSMANRLTGTSRF